MAAAQAGDRAAYETLLRDCIPFIARVARGEGIRPDLIDDVVQETLLTVHRARQTYDPNRSFTAWLRTIAQRRVINGLRRTGRMPGVVRRTCIRSRPTSAAMVPTRKFPRPSDIQSYSTAQRRRSPSLQALGVLAFRAGMVGHLYMRRRSLTTLLPSRPVFGAQAGSAKRRNDKRLGG
jgi:RNA polymerase sigma factor (sigma-70 family)